MRWEEYEMLRVRSRKSMRWDGIQELRSGKAMKRDGYGAGMYGRWEWYEMGRV